MIIYLCMEFVRDGSYGGYDDETILKAFTKKESALRYLKTVSMKPGDYLEDGYHPAAGLNNGKFIPEDKNGESYIRIDYVSELPGDNDYTRIYIREQEVEE